MLSIILASQLWFLDYQAIVNGKNANIGPRPHTGGSHATKAECVKTAKIELPQYQAHSPFPGATWKFTCTRRPWKLKTAAELDAIHNGHAGH